MRANACLFTPALLALAACNTTPAALDALADTADASADVQSVSDAAADVAADVAADAPPEASVWRDEPALPAPRQEISAAVRDGELWVIGGFESGVVVDTVRVYDPRTRAWREGPALPSARHHVAAVTVGSDLYSIGGELGLDFSPDATCYVLRAGATAWQRIAPLPEERGAMAAGEIAGEIVVAAGVGRRYALARPVFRYDPRTDTWRTGAEIPTAREHCAGFVYAGRLWVLGGRNLTLDTVNPAVEAYDPSADRWERMAPMPTARGGFAAAVAGDTALAAGGELSSRALASVDALDLRTGAWRAFAPMAVAHHGHAAVALEGRVYMVGGAVRPIFAPTARVESTAP